VPVIDFQTDPSRYRHWTLKVDGGVAEVRLDVAESGGLVPGYELKLNSYDLGVDIELNDLVTRLRFEHPEVGAVILASGKERVFCAGANIRMLSQSSHAHKVNFCKFTNETRNAIEDASTNSDQVWLCAIAGPAAGGGYELALACERILMADDGNTSVALPEVPLLAVLPGTGGLTRLVDKRKVRRDRADFFSTVEEGVKGKRAVDWRLVDEVVPRTRLETRARELARSLAKRAPARGVALTPLERAIEPDRLRYSTVWVDLDRAKGAAQITLRGPLDATPTDPSALDCGFWPLRLARELDDAILHLRSNEPIIGTWALKSGGDAALVQAHDDFLLAHRNHWLAREIVLLWKRVLKRLDVTSRSLIAVIEPGSCFAGSLLEVALAADRSYMLDGTLEGDNRPPATLRLTPMNFGPLAGVNGLTRLATRFLATPDAVSSLEARIGEALDAHAAEAAGLVTFAPDDIDWEDEVRIALEERASFSPDALTGMEANLRFPGPETMESKIFARLTAWQNWIFQRPNAVGEEGALKTYGTGRRPGFDKTRV
jgi:benzoyl-CoA-dihydrodiol lyase